MAISCGWKKLLLMAGFLGAITAYADTTWVQTGVVSGEWTADGSPYIFSGNLTVSESLVIRPGVTVIAEGPYRITVTGFFAALGEWLDSVRFTCDLSRVAGWGGLYFDNAADTGRINFTVIENARYDSDGVGYYYGTGIASLRTSLTLDGSRLCDNDGGICLQGEGSLRLTSCEIGRNFNDNGGQGGVRIFYGGSASLLDCYVHDNGAFEGAAVLATGSGDVLLQSCRIAYNRATAWGGGCFFNSQTNLIARDCDIYDNISASGGALEFWGETLQLDHCRIFDNQAAANGHSGGIVLKGRSNDIRNCTFAGNRGGNGDDLFAQGRVNINSCLFADSSGNPRLYFDANTIAFGYSAIRGSLTGTIPTGYRRIELVNANGDSCDRYSNIFSDPRLMDPFESDFHLRDESPCIDAGDPSLPIDPDGTTTDIGAFCFYQVSGGREPRGNRPETFEFSRPFPNPFNAAVELEFEIAEPGQVSLTVRDILGRQAAVLADEHLAAGFHRRQWSAIGMSSGTYFAVLEKDGHRSIQKLLLIR